MRRTAISAQNHRDPNDTEERARNRHRSPNFAQQGKRTAVPSPPGNILHITPAARG